MWLHSGIDIIHDGRFSNNWRINHGIYGIGIIYDWKFDHEWRINVFWCDNRRLRSRPASRR